MTNNIRWMLVPIALLLLCASCVAGSGANRPSSGVNLGYALEPEGFYEVKHLTGLIFDVSPKATDLKSDYGIIVTTPARVTLRLKKSVKDGVITAPIPYCLYYALGYPDINTLGEHTLTLQNLASGEKITGKASVAHGEAVFTMPTLEQDSEILRKGGWLSYDMTRFIDVPAASASYAFWITAGSTESNKSTLEVVITKK